MALAPDLAWDGRANRTEDWSFHLLDDSGNDTGDLLHPDVDGLTLSFDGSAQIPRSVRGLVLVGSEATDVDPIGDRLKVFVNIQGTDYPMGVFAFANVTRPRTTHDPSMESTLVDQTVIFDGGIAEPFGGAQGANVGSLMAELVALFPVTFDIVPTDATLPAAIGYPPGTSGARILADLAQAATYVDPYFDNDGIGRLRPLPPVADHEYGPGTIVVAETPADTDDLLSAYNTFVVTGGSGDNPIVGVYSLPGSAPQSEANRGFRVTLTDSNASIATASAARDAAVELARTTGNAYRSISFATTLNPLHDGWDLIDMEGDLFLEDSWRVNMGTGVQSHDATRVEATIYE